MNLIVSSIKKPFQICKKQYLDLRINQYVNKKIKRRGNIDIHVFDFEIFKNNVIEFLQSLQYDANSMRYRYSHDCNADTLYASAYACMTLSLLGELQKYSEKQKKEWSAYFDSFQNKEDGLFYDPEVMNNLFLTADWWGGRHLAMHMLSAYTDLGRPPKYQFSLLKKYYNTEYIMNWLDQYDWRDHALGNGDLDNKIMNIGCLLQYQRDNFSDDNAANSIEFLKKYLRKKIFNETGMWGKFNVNSPVKNSRMIQFAYHLFLLYFYDNDFEFDAEKIVASALKTQNRFGGYGVKSNSSACEDIDSIDILIRFYPYVKTATQDKIRNSIEKAYQWVLLNQADDGGFVFRLNEPFIFGSKQTSSKSNIGAMLPTWFRTLSLAYMAKFLGLEQGFVVTRAPGCEI